MKLIDLPSSMPDWSTLPHRNIQANPAQPPYASRQFGEIQLRMVE